MRSYVLVILMVVLFFIPSSAQEWIKLEAGAEFSIALKSDSTIWACGFNGNGQLGTGGGTENEPVQVGTDSDWVDISVGALNSFAIKEDGTLWAWGYNYYGNLGLGHTQTSVQRPMQVGNDTTWLKISAGVTHTLGLKRDSSLWSFGWNTFGQLGIPMEDVVHVPTRVDSHQYIHIAAGGFHNLAIRSDHTLWGWGNNEVLQIGSQFDTAYVWSPMMIDSTDEWLNISSGFQFSTAQKLDSTLYSWGFNGNSQLGHSQNMNMVGTPILVDSSKQWQMVSAGASFTQAILDDGSLWSWGFNGQGQLGTGPGAQVNVPEQVDQDTSWKYVSAANGYYNPQFGVLGLHSLALKGNKSFICASGANYSGQLGNGTTNASRTYDCSVGDISTFIFTPNEFDAELSVYPVPASHKLTVEYVNATTDWTIELYNAQSKLQIRKELRAYEAFTSNISTLPAGMYYLVVKENGQKTGRQEIVIAR